MVDIIFALLLAIIGIFFVRFIKWYFTLKVKLATEYIEATEKFYASAKPLISDSETPKEVIDTIKFLNEKINDKKTVSYLFRSLSSSRMRYNGLSEEMKIHHEFFAKRPELEKRFQNLVTSWFIAVTALSPLVGGACRISINSDNVEKIAANAGKKPLNKIGKNDDHIGPTAQAC